MSSPAESRPLSLRPFLVADGVLLLTAALVAWRTPDELRGGALLAVVFCSAIGAVLMVLPFVLNEVRRREAELAARQRELAELVKVTNANASRWGEQWTAAATGLEDAASLATRSLAAAERLPAMFEEQAATLGDRLAQADVEASAREARAVERERRAAEREAAAVAQAEKATTHTEALLSRLDQHGARLAESSDRSLAELARVEAGLRARHEEATAVLAKLDEFARRAEGAREAFNTAATQAGAGFEARVAASLGELDARSTAAAERLATQAVEMENALAAATRALAEAGRALENTLAALERASERACAVEASPVAPLASVAAELPKSAPSRPTHAVVEPPAPAPIMDPFYVPEDGYMALAEAMDAGK